LLYYISDVGQWTATQWEKALPLIRKMTSTVELKLMNSDAFKAILSELGQVKIWSKEQASTLLEKAKSVFGDGMNNNLIYNRM